MLAPSIENLILNPTRQPGFLAEAGLRGWILVSPLPPAGDYIGGSWFDTESWEDTSIWWD